MEPRGRRDAGPAKAANAASGSTPAVRARWSDRVQIRLVSASIFLADTQEVTGAGPFRPQCIPLDNGSLLIRRCTRQREPHTRSSEVTVHAVDVMDPESRFLYAVRCFGFQSDDAS